jgi:hypothetical protein
LLGIFSLNFHSLPYREKTEKMIQFFVHSGIARITGEAIVMIFSNGVIIVTFDIIQVFVSSSVGRRHLSMQNNKTTRDMSPRHDESSSYG